MFMLNLLIFFGVFYALLLLLLAYMDWRIFPIYSFVLNLKRDLRGYIKMWTVAIIVTMIAVWIYR